MKKNAKVPRDTWWKYKDLVMFDRRTLLKIFGLGGASVVASATNSFNYKVDRAENKYIRCQQKDKKSFSYTHPESTFINGLIAIGEGYPKYAKFSSPIMLCSGDRLEIGHSVTVGGTQRTFHRVYNVRQACTVLGSAFEAPVIQDIIGPELSSPEILAYNLPATLKHYN